MLALLLDGPYGGEKNSDEFPAPSQRPHGSMSSALTRHINLPFGKTRLLLCPALVSTEGCLTAGSVPWPSQVGTGQTKLLPPMPQFLSATDLTRNAHAPTSPHSTGFCAIWVCISSSLSSTRNQACELHAANVKGPWILRALHATSVGSPVAVYFF